MVKVAEVSVAPISDLNRTIDCFAKQVYDVPLELTIMGPGAELDFAELEEIAQSLEVEASVADFGCFRIMSQKDGDKRIVWCRRVIAQIRAAKQMFMDLLSKGMVPYKVGVDGNAMSEVMTEFDPTAEEVIFIPVRAIAGG